MAVMVAKILVSTIQVNLVSNPSEPWRRKHNSPELLQIFYPQLIYHHSHFLAATLDFTFFHPGFFWPHPFFTAWLFWYRPILFTVHVSLTIDRIISFVRVTKY